MYKIPILILAYKRPQTTRRLLEIISEINPEKLYLSVDGPRNQAEEETVKEVIALCKKKGWAKHTELNIAKTNLGLRNRVVSAVNWVLDKEKWLVVLEDDCIPDKSFFHFADELLHKYENNEKVVSVAGYRYKNEAKAKASYYFSKYVESWGWATWKRAWNLYDDKMVNWDQYKNSPDFKKYIPNRITRHYWISSLDKTREKKLDSWAYRWSLSNFIHKGLTIVPKVNMIEYVGWDESATHTSKVINKVSVMSMGFPLIHPKNVTLNTHNDRLTERKMALIYLGLMLKAYLNFVTSTLKRFKLNGR